VALESKSLVHRVAVTVAVSVAVSAAVSAATVETTAALRQAWVIPDQRASERAPHISCRGPVVIAQTGWAVRTAEPPLLLHELYVTNPFSGSKEHPPGRLDLQGENACEPDGGPLIARIFAASSHRLWSPTLADPGRQLLAFKLPNTNLGPVCVRTRARGYCRVP
jgi:hypothetical protein